MRYPNLPVKGRLLSNEIDEEVGPLPTSQENHDASHDEETKNDETVSVGKVDKKPRTHSHAGEEPNLHIACTSGVEQG